MDTSSNGNGLIQWLTKQGSLGAILGLAMYFGFTNINTRFEGMDKYLEARFDNVQADIQEIKEGQRELIGYMKEHEGRISKLEARLDERQQPAT